MGCLHMITYVPLIYGVVHTTLQQCQFLAQPFQQQSRHFAFHGCACTASVIVLCGFVYLFVYNFFHYRQRGGGF